MLHPLALKGSLWQFTFARNKQSILLISQVSSLLPYASNKATTYLKHLV